LWDPAYGATDSSINLGAGSDSLSITASASGSGWIAAYGIVNSSIFAGDGSDTIYISATSSGQGWMNAIASDSSTIDSGDGSQDIVRINAYSNNTGSGGSTTIGLFNSTVNTRDGNDIISVSAFAKDKSTSYSLYNSTIESGGGSDIIDLSGNWVESSVKGGTGLDILRLTNAGKLSITKANDYNSDNLNFNISSDKGTLAISGIEQVLIGKSIYNLATFLKNGSSKNDLIMLGNSSEIIDGKNGSDTIYAGGGSDIIYGGEGDDKLFGMDGADTLLGGTGNDFLDGGNSDDEIHGESGNDRIWGGSGNDELTGGAGSDLIVGGSGDDILTGCSSNGSGIEIDILSGGLGRDTFVLGDETSSFYANGKANDFAWIQDFESADILRLHGSRENYFTATYTYNGQDGTALYYNAFASGASSNGDIIAFFSSNLSSDSLFSGADFRQSA